jgi:hypothetical protein
MPKGFGKKPKSIKGVFEHPAVASGGAIITSRVTNLGLIDEDRLYLRHIVLGRGKPFFAGPRPPFRLVASDLIAADVMSDVIS